MTMLAHTLKNILELIPEALPLVKEASIDQESPLDSRGSTIATALQVKYFEKVAYQEVDVFSLDKIANAVRLYGVGDIVTDLTTKMVKAAQDIKLDNFHNTPENYQVKLASFEEDPLANGVEKRSQVAKELYKEAITHGITPSETVVLYSGNGYLDKEAAVKSLSVRYHATKNTDFVKIASALGHTPDANLTSDLLTEVADVISSMDVGSGLNFKGYNFYKEAFHTKEAAYKGSMNVTLCGKQVPYESIERVGREKIAAYMGGDIAQEMDSGPQNFKSVIETLPLDLQNVLSSLIRNV